MTMEFLYFQSLKLRESHQLRHHQFCLNPLRSKFFVKRTKKTQIQSNLNLFMQIKKNMMLRCMMSEKGGKIQILCHLQLSLLKYYRLG
jgi:hypothetical protein